MKILEIFDFLSDEKMVQLQYWVKTGRKLNLDKPMRYTEKLQWYKLYYRDDHMWRCADKFTMREYVREVGYEYLLNPLYAVYERIEDIKLEELPKEFVLKSSLGSGAREIIICSDKCELDWDNVKKQIPFWLRKVKKHAGREWVYEGHKPRLLVEKLLKTTPELIDYKFYCFFGQCKLIHVAYDRKIGEDVRCAFFDKDFNYIDVAVDCERKADFNNLPQRPKKFKEMIEIAETLSAPFPHVRIDLYNVDEKITLGEFTFFNMSGYMNFVPDEFDFRLGRKFRLPLEGRDNF